MEVDLAKQAHDLVMFLTPLFPYLCKAGEKLAEEIAGDTWEKAKAVWGRLFPYIEGNNAIQPLIEKSIADSKDTRVQMALELGIEDLLKSNPELAQQIGKLMASEVVQQVLAEGGSKVKDIEQSASGSGKTEQHVIARENSTVEGVKQSRQ